MVGNPLKRYYQILEGEARAKYLETKERRLDVSLRAGTKELWKAHDGALSLRPTEGPRSITKGTNLLEIKAELARRMLGDCMLCERRCGSNRSAGEKGHCGVLEARISTDFLHMGEEPDLVPSYTIFFTGCTFECVFCQNWDISTRPGEGHEIPAKVLARKIEARSAGAGRSRELSIFGGGTARNTNWVGGDPTSNLPFILEILTECSANLPQVWNSNMYLSEESMRLLDGVIDVYLTDFKYGNDDCAFRLSNAPGYMEIVKRNHTLARSQCEMIIRHLVLPGHIECCTQPILEWIAENLDNVKVNVMAQYKPEHRARDFEELSRPLRIQELKEALRIAEELGLDCY